MRLVSWNINGLRAGFERGVLPLLEQRRPTVLCLQETRADPDTLSPAIRQPPGYTSYWAVARRAGYSGVSTMTRCSVTAWTAGLGIERFDVEGRVLITEMAGFDLYNIYCPSASAGPERLAYKLDFYAAFLDHIDARIRTGRPIIFCGDVNTAHRPADLARPNANARRPGFLPEERAWLDRWEAHGWVDSFRWMHPDAREAYTWWDRRTGARARNVGWRLDYIFVHAMMLHRVTGAGICSDVHGSDHCPVWIELAD
jgi:exodeoxyribonuclease-3